MARNGSGTYSLPSGNPVVTGTTISSTVHNNTMSDIATALTGSLAKNGETVITGDLDFNGNDIIVDTDGDSKIGELNDDVTFFSFNGTNGVLMGHGTGNTGAFVHVNPGPFTATAATDIARLRVGNTSAITVPAGSTVLAAAALFEEPNLTATGTIDTAATVYIEAAPTEGAANYALLVDAGDVKFDGATQLEGALTANEKITLAANKGLHLTEGTAPSTAASQGALYTKDTGGQPELFFREESDGDEVQITSGGSVNDSGGSTTIASGSLPSANNLDITDIPSTYAALVLTVNAASFDTATRSMEMTLSSDNGSSFYANSFYGTTAQGTTNVSNANSGDALALGTQTAAQTVSFTVVITGYQSNFVHIVGAGTYGGGGTWSCNTTYAGGASTVDAIRLIMNDTGNFDAGSYTLVGVK